MNMIMELATVKAQRSTAFAGLRRGIALMRQLSIDARADDDEYWSREYGPGYKDFIDDIATFIKEWGWVSEGKYAPEGAWVATEKISEATYQLESALEFGDIELVRQHIRDALSALNRAAEDVKK